jgi:PBSX family phage terminase large subunit
MAFSTKQMEVFRFPYTPYDALIADGSIRSGKSSAISISFILSTMERFNNCSFAICSRTIRAAERNIIKPLLGVAYFKQHGYKLRFSTSLNTLTVKRGNKTNTFYIFGGNDESSYMLIQGVTLAGVFLDEVALMPRSFVEQAIARCSVEGSKFFFSCNPEAPSHWFYLEWILKAKEKNAMYLHFDMDDNPSLTEVVKARYRAMYDGVFYERYIKGAWVKAEGIIYRRFADHPENYTLTKIPNDIVSITVGVDFGGNKSAHTFIASGITKSYGALVVLEAEKHTQELSPEMLDALFTVFCERVYDKYKMPFVSRCDNAEPVLLRGLKNAAIRKGIRTEVKPAFKKPIRDRINTLVRLIGTNRFFVMSHCTTVIRAISEAVWDDKNPDQRLDDGTSDIDTLDGLEYSFEEHIKDFIDTEGMIL